MTTQLMNLYQSVNHSNGITFSHINNGKPIDMYVAMVDNPDYGFQAQIHIYYDSETKEFVLAKYCKPSNLFTGRELKLTKQRKQLLENFVQFNTDYIKEFAI